MGTLIQSFGREILDFSSSFLQSIAISSIQSVLATIVSALAGFLLAKYSFRGKGSDDWSCDFDYPDTTTGNGGSHI